MIPNQSTSCARHSDGRFICNDAEADIREKEFMHSCDVATLGMAMQRDPETAEHFTETILKQRYEKEIAHKYLHTFHLIHDISNCCHLKQFRDVHDKLFILEDAMGKLGLSENLIWEVGRLNVLDIHDGMGGRVLDIKAKEAEKICRNIIDLWKNES